jgi:G:T/U-mismatch repair DNA glycosylase
MGLRLFVGINPSIFSVEQGHYFAQPSNPVHCALTAPPSDPSLGLQSLRFGRTRLFLVSSPSGANTHFTPADQTAWYDRLASCLAQTVQDR